MKRVLFACLAAASMFAFACQPQPGNTNSNANANVSRPTSTEEQVTALTSQDKAVVIVITGDAANPILLVPDPITLKRSKNEKVRWCVYNNLDDGVDNVTITDFKPYDPFDPHPPFETGSIAAGNPGCTGKGKAASLGEFKYTITVTRSGQPPLVKDPGVIITD